ncbi:MAG: PKD domain-containing protein [Acidobacteriota bacterium]|nr:PKD domain-containing protein [Acidobacteriota bacterium]
MLLVFAALACGSSVWAGGVHPHSNVTLYSIPDEVRSSHFRVSVDGRGSDVLHAASGYYLLNFDVAGPATVSVTADDPHYWDAGVEIQPMRFGIRPVRHGATITFPIPGPVKLTIARPGNHFADAEILFLFANSPDHTGITASTPRVRFYGPGAHHENIDARSGETIYLAPGAVVFGSLNLWQVHDVRVLGTGTIVYDGPQDPHTDEGYMHKRSWHVVVMEEARNIEIDGITCITRSRSWQIQMRDSRHIGLYNVKVIGGNPNDANQDGMDWLGGGDTTVRDSFFRASDDVFAIQGNNEFYDPALVRAPGLDVSNITIEDTIASTSISNTVRVNWPQKVFNSSHFHMSDVDVIHTGFGACKVPFAFFELWADPEGRGSHTDYRFRNVRLEDWYSLFQIRQPLPQVREVSFEGVWAMDGAAMVAPVLKGDVSGVSLRGATLQGFAGDRAEVEDGAMQPVIERSSVDGHFTYTSGLLHPRQRVTFTADALAEPGRRFAWTFGDGTRGEGRTVEHSFPDAEGTLLDRTGRFRVLLHITDADGNQTWGSRPVVLARAAVAAETTLESVAVAGARTFERQIRIPADGGYTFTLLTSLNASLSIDGKHTGHSSKPRAQVCGAEGDAVQPVRVSAALNAGIHRIRIVRAPGLENAGSDSGVASAAPDAPVVLWEGPSIDRKLVPAGAYEGLAR